MKPLHSFIVQIPKKFKDELSFNGGTLKIITKFDEFASRVNNAKIIGVPNGVDESNIGKTLYFHHHVVMEQKYDIGENLFLVNYDPAGGYANHAISIEDEDGNFTMLGDWCFILPPAEKEEDTNSSILILSLEEKPELEGEVFALPADTEWIGASPGNVVGYTKDSDYTMELQDGTKVYRMRITELMYAKED